MSIKRKTKTVSLILKVFEKRNEAKSAKELVQKFNKIMDKTTVYRILERLEESNMLHSFIGQDGLKRYARGNKNKEKIHPHFLCQDCGISSCLPIKLTVPSIPDYLIHNTEQTFIGKCNNCLPDK